MGSGASHQGDGGNTALVAQQAEKIHALTQQNEDLQNEIKSLKKRMDQGGAELVAQNSIRPSMVVNAGGAGVGKRSSVARMSSAHSSSINGPVKARRGEVSAEAWNKKPAANMEKDYERVVFPKEDSERELIMGAVNDNILFKGLSSEEKNECVDAFEKIPVKAGDNVITQGEQGDAFYIVNDGELEVLVKIAEGVAPAHYGNLATGDSFGELSLMYNAPRAATIHAKTDCTLWVISREQFRSIHLHYKMLRKAVFEKYLRNVKELKDLTDQELARLADAVEEEHFEKGAVIIREGEVGDNFYIIVKGHVEYSKKEEGVVGKGEAGNYFGQLALLTEDKRAATVTAMDSVTCLTMDRAHFVSLIGSLHELANREIPSTVQEESGGSSDSSAGDDDWHKEYKDIKFQDLQRKFPSKRGEREIILGQGAFGLVQIVKHKETGETFALKCLNKSQIVENSLETHVVDERKVMTMIDHPFLLKLYNSYHDNKYVYFLLELCLGGELFTVLRKRTRFAEKASKFYSATVVQAFGHLHSKSIVYRDLKPENLMLDNDGYIKVVDFGLAKVVKDRTWTLCGTPDYLAPEIILSKGHDKAVDWWALGVLTYEMTAGYVPFFADDPLDVYQLILDGELKFPSHMSRSCCDLIRRLLNPYQSKRLGNTKEGIQGVIKHRWFAGFDWDGLYARTIVPPIQVNVKNKEDTSNFDDYAIEKQEVPDCTSWVPPFPHKIE